METFAELLSFLVERAGISDTELARAVGVSRQTVFRWREGLTNRPNNREDVLAIAEKLRLSSEERDHLLLIAGFRPEEMRVPENGEADQQNTAGVATGRNDYGSLEIERERNRAENTSSYSNEKKASGKKTNWWYTRQKRYRWVFGVFIVVLLCALIIWFVLGGDSDDDLGNQSDATNGPDSTLDVNAFVPAAYGETLIVVTRFEGVSDDEGFTEQFVTALEREIYGSRSVDMRVAIWPEMATELDEASQLFADSGAVLIAYGKNNGAQIEIRLFPGLSQETGIEQLKIGSNGNLHLEIRSLALVTLGHLYIIQDDPQKALSFLAQARNILQDDLEQNESIAATVDALMLQVYNEIE